MCHFCHFLKKQRAVRTLNYYNKIIEDHQTGLEPQRFQPEVARIIKVLSEVIRVLDQVVRVL